MSKKYSSDDKMQNLFEGFRKSLNENEDISAAVADYRARKNDYKERIAAGMNYEYRRSERAGKHMIFFIHPSKGNGYEFVRLEFPIGGRGQTVSDAEKSIQKMGHSWSSLVSAANQGDEKAITILHAHGDMGYAMNEVRIGTQDYIAMDIADGARPEQTDIVNDLVDTMAKAGYDWAQHYGKNQTPEMAAKFEMFADKLEDALNQAAKALYKV